MKRIHMGIVVADFEESLKFYTDLLGTGPTLQKDGYARWMLDDPRVNLNINVQGMRVDVEGSVHVVATFRGFKHFVETKHRQTSDETH